MDIPEWLTQLSLIDPGYVDSFFFVELADLQNDCSLAMVERVKRQQMWMYDEIQERYPKLADKAAKRLIPLPLQLFG